MSEVLCEADFNYVVGNAEPRPFKMTVLNGREFKNPGWEICGFELKQHPSSVAHWSDDEEIKKVHYGEVADFARQLTGCAHALVGSHISRNPEQAEVHQDLAPIQFVHSDFAPSYGDLMRQYYAGDSAEARLSLARENITPREVASARRMVILQFWRNVGPSKMDLPIAFCDARTVGKNEVLAFPVKDYAGGGFEFETLGIDAPADDHHKWYSFPEMIAAKRRSARRGPGGHSSARPGKRLRTAPGRRRRADSRN